MTNPIFVNDILIPFALVKVYAPDLGEENHVYQGDFLGNIPVTLGRFGKDSLVFIMPLLANGSAELKVKINGELRIWKLNIGNYIPPPTPNESVFDALLRNNESLISEMKEYESLYGISQDYQKWINQLRMEYSQLSDTEKTVFEGVFTQYKMRLWIDFLNNPHSELKVPACDDNPISIFSQRINVLYNLFFLPHSTINFDYLAKYADLPDSKLYRSIKLGIGLTIWYHNCHLEAMAAKTLSCPILRKLVFKIQGEQEGLFIDQPILSMESSGPSEFYIFGNFQKPNKTSNYYYETRFISDVEWFKLFKMNSSKTLVILAKDIPVPKMKEELLYTILETAEIEQIPLPPSYSVKVEIYDQPTVRMVDTTYNEGKLKMEFESLTGMAQDFVLWVYSRNFKGQISGRLKVSCGILARVVLEEEKALVDIQYGSPPYQITWSNGLEGAGPFDLVSGRYTIQVVDSGGCERSMEFEMPEFSIVTDIDGNIYRTVKIGNQWWMAENLRTTRKNDGTPIQKVDVPFDWSGSLSWYFSLGIPENDQKYGKFYNSNAICCGICPTGWRMPQGKDWKDLIDYLNPRHATKMKTTEGWKQGVTGTNISGFGAYSSGYISRMGAHLEEGSLSHFWVFSPNPNVPIIPPNYLIKFNSSEYSSFGGDNSFELFPVRCIKE